MPYLQGSFPIVQKKQLTSDVYSVVLECPGIASQAVPGQFVHIGVPGFQLRRPVSICELDETRLRLVFQVRGAGTKALAALEPGASMDLLGPLGNGFPALPAGSKVLLVGGGIGVPPLLALARRYGTDATALLGSRSQDAVILEDDFSQVCDTRIATDDGSRGRRGFVSSLLEQRLTEGPADMVFACGPTAMLKGIVTITQAHGVPAKISVEERMACGVGACLVCACRTVRDGKEIYSHVCTDGPVFDGGEVVFE